MQLKLIRHLWGVDEAPETALPRFKQQGYTGIEVGLLVMPQPQRLGEMIIEYGFDFVPQIFTADFDPDPDLSRHVDSFAKQLEAVAKFNPIFVNCHSGCDAWSAETAASFYERALKIESELGIPIGHETHRGRYFFNPWNTAAMLDRFSDLKLCCDLSHWVCVCERLIHDQIDIIRKVADRTLHLHARVGYEEGPQVPDPSAPEYRRHLEAHESWWNIVWESQRRRGMAVSTLTPEFGPPPYLHTLPHTNAPVVNLESVCNWIAHRETERFNGLFS